MEEFWDRFLSLACFIALLKPEWTALISPPNTLIAASSKRMRSFSFRQTFPSLPKKSDAGQNILIHNMRQCFPSEICRCFSL